MPNFQAKLLLPDSFKNAESDLFGIVECQLESLYHGSRPDNNQCGCFSPMADA